VSTGRPDPESEALNGVVPLRSHSEVAILSVGCIADRPVVRDGQLATAPIGYVSVTFGHRVVDGARAAEFGLAVIR